MSQALAERPQNNVIAMPQTMPEFKMLDVYSDTGVTEIEQDSADSIATISAGKKVEKNGKEYPAASRDGTIYLHDEEGRAPGLAQALAMTGYKSLTIAFPFDDPSRFIRQMFTEYSATSLLAFGDDEKITVTKQGGQRVEYLAGTPEYEAAKSRCKVSTFLYFYLAEWGERGPEVIFPDGLGFYRLRFTSRNSARSILTSIQTVMRYTGGRIAGLPFELSITYRDVPDSTNTRRKVAVWNALFKPPQTIALNSGTFRKLAESSLAQGQMLQLPPPTDQQVMLALEAGPDADLDEVTEDEVEIIAQGGMCDAAHYRKRWFAVVGDSHIGFDEARAVFLHEYTSGEYSSLADYLAVCNDEQATQLIDAANTEAQTAQDQWQQYEWFAKVANFHGIKRKNGEPWPSFEKRPRPDIGDKAISQVWKAIEEARGIVPGQEVLPIEEAPAPSAKEIEPPAGRDLKQAVRDKVEEAVTSDDPEGEALFETADEPPQQPTLDDAVQEGEVVEPPKPIKPSQYFEGGIDPETGEDTRAPASNLPPHLQNIIGEALRQGLPVDDVAINGPAIVAINIALVNGKKAQVSCLHDIKAGVAAFILPKLVDGTIKWGGE